MKKYLILYEVWDKIYDERDHSFLENINGNNLFGSGFTKNVLAFNFSLVSISNGLTSLTRLYTYQTQTALLDNSILALFIISTIYSICMYCVINSIIFTLPKGIVFPKRQVVLKI